MRNIPSARHAAQWHEIVASVFVCTEHLAERLRGQPTATETPTNCPILTKNTRPTD